jgi:serine/threonine-protein kinase
MQSYSEEPRMNGASVFLIAFFTAVFTASGTVFVIQRANLLPPTPVQEQSVSVPNIKGLLEEDAVANLRASGLVPLIGGREPTAEAKPGTVIRQTLPPGQNVAKGQSVAVTLAAELPVVPEVVGRSIAEATLLVEQAGYRSQKSVPAIEDKAPEGTVLKQVPTAGTPLEKGKAMLLLVSAGVQTPEVPKVTGLTFANAKTELERSGLSAGTVRWVYVHGGGTMVVLNQDPKPGTKLKPASAVALTVNRD